MRLWLRLLACTNLIERRVSGRLRESFDTTLPRFDFLSQLERSPAGLRMSEISQRMMVTGGNITRIADGLLAEGLITRTVAPGDRRASIVRLTAAGRRAFAEMARRHEALDRRDVRRAAASASALSSTRCWPSSNATSPPVESDPPMNRTHSVRAVRGAAFPLAGRRPASRR